MTRPDAHPIFRRPVQAPAALVVAVAALIAGLAPARPAWAQAVNPVYVDDSPAASESLGRLADLVAAGNLTEASRVLQRLLEEEGTRLIAVEGDSDLFISVREAVHRRVLDTPALLKAYRETQREAAQRVLDAGRTAHVERVHLLTSAGYEAALRLAQQRLERAQFAAAWRTLEQLERHPDRAGGAGARDGAELLTLVSRYLPAAPVLETAHRWRVEAGLEAETPADPVPHPAIGRGVSPLSAVGRVDMTSLVASPLRSERLSIAELTGNEPEQRQMRRATGAPAGGVQQFVMPVVAGDRIYINDAHKITAWDRFSLSPLWSIDLETIETTRLRMIALRRMIEDVSTVTVHGPWLIAAAGVAVDGGREGDNRIFAIDADSGRVRWALNPADAHPSLAESTVRGPLRVDQGVVVVAMAKHVRQRRLVSIHMAGFDLETGGFLWSKPLGSTGTLPYGANILSSEDMAIETGLAYRADRLGFVAAVDTVSGRIRWVRRMDANSGQRAGEPAWQMTGPAVIHGLVYTLSPDRREVIALDAETGAVSIRQPAGVFGDPAYMLRAEGALVFVGASSIVAIDAHRFADRAAAQRVAGPMERAVIGRVQIAGEHALTPVEGGVVEAPLAGGGATKLQEIDHSGNLVATPSQIVVVDDTSLHSYLLWDVAERLLLDRMRASPNDPAPAATFAELAYRGGRTDRIVSAVDAALAAIETDPMRATNQRVRGHLFDAVLSMVEPRPDAQARAALPRTVRIELFDRLDRLAASSEQRVQRLMALGVFHERSGEVAQAVDAYQRVLASDALAGVRLELADTRRPAEDEAAARLRRIVREHGAGVYALYEAEAARALATAMRDPDTAQLDRLARRYPVARAAAEAWYEMAQRLADRGRPRGAISALEQAMRIADDAIPGADPLVGRIAGRLVRMLVAHGRAPAAAGALDRLMHERPGLVLIDRDESIDAWAMRAQLRQTLARLYRRPVVGPLPRERKVQTLVNWSLAEPVLAQVSGGPTDVALLVSGAEFGLWEVHPEGGLRMRWSVPREQDDLPIALDEGGVLVSGRTIDGRRLSLHHLDTGETLWSTELHTGAAPQADIEEEEGQRPRTRIEFVETPMGLRRPAKEALVVADERRLVMAERTGVIGAFDRRTGRRLWTDNLQGLVQDAVVSEDVVVVACVVQAGEDEEAELRFLDAATGRELHRARPEGGQVRWLRATGEGEVIAGLDTAIIAFDPADAQRRWQVGGAPGADTVDAWAFPGRLIVMNSAGQIRQIETEDGAVRPGELDTRNRLERDRVARPVTAAMLDDRVALTGQQALLLYNRSGELVGLDHASRPRLMTPAAFASDRIVVVDQQIIEQDESSLWYSLLVYSADSMLLIDQAPIGLGTHPERVGVLDGRVLVSAGGVVVVIDTEPLR